MNWNLGFTSSCYMSEVNEASWLDRNGIEIISGSVKREATDLRDSAEVTLTYYDGKERWVRIYMDTSQNGESGHVPLFTGLATSPGRDINGHLTTNRVSCYSVLKPCADVMLQRGWYAPTDITAGAILRGLLAYTPAPFRIDGEMPSLSQSVVAEDDETALTMVDKILKAVNSNGATWRLRLNGDGSIVIEQVSSKPVAIYSTNLADSIEPEITVERDWYSLPNVLRAVSDDLVAIARDDSIDSPLSVQNRGREIWAQEDNVDLNENESIGDYAIRRLKELQSIAETISYKRRFNPDIFVGDLVSLHYPECEIDGDYKVSTQNITLEHGAETTEEVNQGVIGE